MGHAVRWSFQIHEGRCCAIPTKKMILLSMILPEFGALRQPHRSTRSGRG